MMATSAANTASNDEFHKLLLVVKDLTQQLDENRQATTRLKLHADLLKVSPSPHLFPNFRNNCDSRSMVIPAKTYIQGLMLVLNSFAGIANP